MAERGDAAEVSLSVRNEDDISPECLAWADSCLINFPDDSDNTNWETFRDALTEIMDIHPEIFVPSSTQTRSVSSPDVDMTETESSDLWRYEPEADSTNVVNNSSTEELSEMISLLTFESDPSSNSLQDHYPPKSMAENGIREPVNSHTIDESVSNGEAEEQSQPESFSSQVFKDDFMSTSVQDNDDDFNVSVDPVKATPQEIFKVWDLEFMGDEEEEDGLVLQLNKALNECSTVQPLNDELVVVEKSNIDDLISGISDLSLAESYN